MGFDREQLCLGTRKTPARPGVPRLTGLVIQTPAGDIPIRSVSIANTGSCLVAANNKVRERRVLPETTPS